MTVSRHLLCWALLTCCRGASSALDGDAPAPTRDRPKEMAAPDSGFVDDDDDAHEPIPDQSKEVSAPDSGFVDHDASAPIPDPSKEMPSPDIGFSYLETREYRALIEKMRELPLPNKKLLPHLTERFVTFDLPHPQYPARFREVRVGADKDLMGGVKLYRSAQPWTNIPPPTHSEYLSMSGNSKQTEISLYNVNFLRDHNVKNVINLNPLKFSPDSQLMLRNTGIRVEHIPVSDYTAPTLQQIRLAIRSIENARKSNECTWVFCGYGDGRTGTIVAAYEVWKISQAYPELSSEELRTFVMRRSGYVKVAHEMFSDADQVNDLVNAYHTHKIEEVEQLNAILELADDISKTCVVNL